MSFRQDKLVLLLDTGTSAQVRRTAARQIAELALKTFRASVNEDVKDVKPDTQGDDAKVQLAASTTEDDAWNEALDTISKVLPLLRSKSSESRNAAATALGLLAQYLPAYAHTLPSSSSSEPVDVAATLKNGSVLLASAGREYIAKPSAGDKAKRRKAMMGSLGLGDAVGWGDDVDKVIGEEEDPMEVDAKPVQPETPPEPPKDIFEGLSARQITMLKRKKGNIEEEANKLRKLNQQVAGAGSGNASGTSAPASRLPTPHSSPPSKASPLPETVTIDPGAKARAAGGAVEPVMDSNGNAVTKTAEVLSLTHGESPWATVLLEIAPGLSDPAWQTRHGSALATMEITRHVGASLPPPLVLDLARDLLQVLVLDRFGDFVGDTVVAPVRETAAQALGVLLKFLDFDTVVEIHQTFVQMVKQPWAKRGKESSDAAKGEKFSWEVRHAGLLGLKYEVAVRQDLLSKPLVTLKTDTKPDVDAPTFLEDVVDNAVLAMDDTDDDVRTVAGLSLLPITDTLSTTLPKPRLTSLLDTLWNCLAKESDDLGSSVGAVMDLLNALVHANEVIAIMEEYRMGRPKDQVIPRIFNFVRHPIAAVRVATAQVLHTVCTDERFIRTDWMYPEEFSKLVEILLLEERGDIRDLVLASFEAALIEGLKDAGMLLLTRADLLKWYSVLLTPIGAPMDETLLGSISGKQWGHNIDKAMIAGDLSLVSRETVLSTRISAAKALAVVRENEKARDLGEEDEDEENGDALPKDLDLLIESLQSSSAHKILMACIVIQEWAENWHNKFVNKEGPFYKGDGEKEKAAQALLAVVTKPPLPTYDEMTTILIRIQAECAALLSAFSLEAKVANVPSIPTKVDALSQSADNFTIATAQAVLGPHFDTLVKKMSKPMTQKVLPSLRDRQRKIMASIGYFSVMKDQLDVQTQASIAAALVSMQAMPDKFGPVVKALMDGVKKEESEILQGRSAFSVARFVELCNGPYFTGANNPSAKIVKNLFTFLCQDTAVTPVFTPSTEGIYSLKEDKPLPARKAAAGVKEEVEETESQRNARITRRGATEAFRALSRQFKDKLFDTVPKFWEGLSAALLTYFPPDADINEVDQKLEKDLAGGQAIVDCLTSVSILVSELDSSLQHRFIELFPSVILALTSSYAIIRSSAAKCLAALCAVIPEEGMRRVVDSVVPLVGDAKRIASRQGAVEAINHIIRTLDIGVLPYVLFLIVPILGRMSDPDESTRLLSTRTFALLIRMVPLEAGLPDPPGFSPELLAKRDEERKFLMQLLDGRKAEQYEIPIPIKADLRQYQRDGVSWLAFLAKYQLHGILCDDMGLGKSLQSICIIGSKHFERAAKHKETGSVDSAHLPSLIVCPPTLIGHWYYEVLKFTDHLRPFQYTGSAGERAALRNKLRSHDVDVVITSYEIVRTDIAELSKIDWLYCVLDEGHIIKNAKTKLSAAVKQLRAQHRLLLSGTPIQNNVLELWSLFDFLMPGFLGNERLFNDRFSKPILADRDGKASPREREAAAAALEALHKQVLPFLLRRLKEDVLHDLPPKIIQDYYCELSSSQKALYDEFSKSKAAEEAGEAVSGDSQPGQGHVFQSLQYLRKLCNHPALVLDGPEGKQRWGEVVKKVGGDLPPLHDISHAPKLLALKQLLIDCGIGLPPAEKLGTTEELPQHRVLIFCQLRPMLDLIERDLFASAMPGVKYMRMDGQTEPRKRHAIVQTFNADPRIDVLLLTTSVGGLGLNLTGADTVIFVDHDWNPMKDLQAMDRAHRLGQKKVVNVYRLITRGTLEEKIMGLQRFKLNIASSVVTQQNAGLGSMNTGEVLDLFKVSAEPGPAKVKSTSSGPVSASHVLEGLEDLPPEDEYAELSLSNFMSKV